MNAIPYGGKKKGADSGIDGFIYFKPDGKTTRRPSFPVKGGDNVGVPMIRDLGHVVDREKAKIGVFITLAEPTKPMTTEAVKTGYYETPYKVPEDSNSHDCGTVRWQEAEHSAHTPLSFQPGRCGRGPHQTRETFLNGRPLHNSYFRAGRRSRRSASHRPHELDRLIRGCFSAFEMA